MNDSILPFGYLSNNNPADVLNIQDRLSEESNDDGLVNKSSSLLHLKRCLLELVKNHTITLNTSSGIIESTSNSSNTYRTNTLKVNEESHNNSKTNFGYLHSSQRFYSLIELPILAETKTTKTNDLPLNFDLIGKISAETVITSYFFNAFFN